MPAHGAAAQDSSLFPRLGTDVTIEIAGRCCLLPERSLLDALLCVPGECSREIVSLFSSISTVTSDHPWLPQVRKERLETLRRRRRLVEHRQLFLLRS